MKWFNIAARSHKPQGDEKRPHVLHVLQHASHLDHRHYALSLRQRLAQATGLTAVLGFVLADFFSDGLSSFSTLDWKLVALVLPFLLLPLALTFPYPAGHSSLRQYVLIGFLVIGLAMASYFGINHRGSIWFNQESLTLATIYIYFLSGLSLFRAIFCGLAAWLAFSISAMGDPTLVGALHVSPYLLVANIVGALGLWYLEWHAAKRHALEMALRSDAMSDDLTGLLNRRAIDQHLSRVWRQACRDKKNLCILKLDIDHFYKLNARVGSAMGDSALRYIAGLLESEARRSFDAVGRSDSDEFLLILYGYDPDRFAKITQTIPKAISKFALGDSLDIEPLTVSGGAVIVQPQQQNSEEWEQLIDLLHRNLTRARYKGRDQVVLTDLRHPLSAVVGSLGAQVAESKAS